MLQIEKAVQFDKEVSYLITRSETRYKQGGTFDV